jgi:hypothetical protein
MPNLPIISSHFPRVTVSIDLARILPEFHTPEIESREPVSFGGILKKPFVCIHQTASRFHQFNLIVFPVVVANRRTLEVVSGNNGAPGQPHHVRRWRMKASREPVPHQKIVVSL